MTSEGSTCLLAGELLIGPANQDNQRHQYQSSISRPGTLEELNSDWTGSQELADVLMSKYKVPFRVGHHFGSEIVTHAKAHNIKPLDFPYAEAQKIYRESVKEYSAGTELPMSEAEFRSTLNPVAIVQNRRTVGGPQLPEMKRMLALAKKQTADQQQWILAQRTAIDGALGKLNQDFAKLLTP